MELSDEQTRKLLEYPGRLPIRQLGLNMSLTRLRQAYRANPTAVTISQCRAALNQLLQTYAGIMRDDYDRMLDLCGDGHRNEI